MADVIESTLYLSVTAILILLFKWIFKNKLSAKWHVLIWALLAVRLVLPSLPESSLSIFNVIDVQKTEITEESVQKPENPDTVAELVELSQDDGNRQEVRKADVTVQNNADVENNVTHDTEDMQVSENIPVTNVSQTSDEIQHSENTDYQKNTDHQNNTDGVMQNTPKEAEHVRNVRITPVKKHKVNVNLIVNTVRYGIAGLIFIYFVVVYVVCLVRMNKNGKAADASLFGLLEECKAKIGIKRRVRLMTYGNSPMLIGALKPKIILPNGYSEDENKHIIIHELCHLKSGDIVLLWLAMLVLCLNWYNPIIWICFFTFRRDIEVYCDERVLRYVDSKKDYASLLVKTALKKNSFIAGTTSLQNGEKEVERRVKYMAYFKKPHFVWTMLIVVVAAVIAVVCLTNPKEDAKPTDKKEAAEQKDAKEDDEKTVNNVTESDEEIYNLFLENAVKAKIDNKDYTLSQYINERAVDGMKMEYTFFDMNGDGAFEFHLKSPRSYDIFTVKDGQMKLWYEGSAYEHFTNDGNILYCRYGGAPNNREYIFKELDYDGNVVSEVSWSVYELDDSGNITDDSVFYNGDGVEITKDEYYDFIKKYDNVPYDCEWTTFYQGLKTEIFEDKDASIESNITIQYPTVVGMKDTKLQEKINSTIKEAALERYNDYSSDLFKDGFDNTSWPVDYTVAHYGDRFISIYFEGYIYTKGYAHGSDTCWTVNVDLSTGKRIKLGDVFDDTFCEYVTFENFGNGAFADAEAFEMLFGTDKEYLEADFTSESNDNFFFGDNELGINLYMYSDYYNYFTTDYESLKGCMKEHPIWQELGVKRGKVLQDTPNFYLEEKSPTEYYCEVYGNSGEMIFSDTIEKSPEFTNLEGPLYELTWGLGTFAWKSIFFNLETCSKSSVYDRPFYLTNGVVACVNNISTFDVGSPTKTGELTFIELFDLYDSILVDSISAEFLKESTSYIIEYVDDTHISVTYYTDGGQKENKKILEISSITGALTEDDFRVTYNGFTFDFDTTVEEITSYFPTSERGEEPDNWVFIAGCPTAQRFSLYYPGFDNPDIRIVCIENLETGDSFIEYIEVFDESIKTSRGYSVGDNDLDIWSGYGKGNFVSGSGVMFSSNTYYFKNGKFITFSDGVDNDMLIDRIEFSYNPNSPESRAIDNYQNSFDEENISLPIETEDASENIQTPEITVSSESETFINMGTQENFLFGEDVVLTSNDNADNNDTQNGENLQTELEEDEISIASSELW